MPRRRTLSSAILLSTALLSKSVVANPEPAVLSDGRSVAMGGTGVATNDYATAPYHNPAGLSSVKDFSAALAFTPFLSKVSAPFTDPVTGETVERDSKRAVAPLVTAAAGVRVHERVALGAIAFLTAGSGAKYENAVGGKDVEGLAFAGEAQLPIAVTITDRLSVGGAYRITAARFKLNVPAPLPPPAVGLADTETTLSGVNYTGFALGARYRVSDAVRLGVTYRSKVVVDLDGETDVTAAGTTQTSDATGEFPVPHTIKIGTELSLLDQKLVVAVDGAYWFYSDSHDEDPSVGRPAAWEDAMAGMVGVEYRITDMIPVRAGVNIGNSATSAGAASPFGLGPGMLYTFGAGSGLRLDRFDFDVAGGYVYTDGESVSASDNPQFPGAYGGNSIFASISASYRM